MDQCLMALKVLQLHCYPAKKFHKLQSCCSFVVKAQYQRDLQILHSAQFTGSAGTGVGCKAGTLDIWAYLGGGEIYKDW